MEYKASYDNFVKIITISIIVIVLIISIKSLRSIINTNLDTSGLLNIFLVLFVVMMIIIIWLYSPKSYYLDDDRLIIKRQLGKVVINLKDIKNIEKISNEEMKGTIRYFGVGGLFGYYGKFYIPSYGKVIFYATQSKNRILIETKDNKKFLITPFTELLNL